VGTELGSKNLAFAISNCTRPLQATNIYALLACPPSAGLFSVGIQSRPSWTSLWRASEDRFVTPSRCNGVTDLAETHACLITAAINNPTNAIDFTQSCEICSCCQFDLPLSSGGYQLWPTVNVYRYV